MKYKNIKYFLLGLIIFMININVIGQSDLSTPYSRFGLGDIYTGSPNTMLRGMGGVANAMSGDYGWEASARKYLDIYKSI